MQIILLEKVQNVGDLGEVVKVRQGYARNFLIPQGKAKRATPENLKMLEEKRSELERLAADRLTQAQERAAKLEGVSVGHTVEKAMVRMPDGPLKHVGEFPLTIALHADAVAHVNVHVLGDTTGVQAG